MAIRAHSSRACAAAVLAGSLALAGCGGSGTVASSPDVTQAPAGTTESTPAGTAPAAETGPEGGTEGATAAPAAPTGITISPKAGARDVRNDTVVTVSAPGGRLSDVKVVDAGGRVINGAYDAARTTWRTTDPLRIGTQYEVRARARNAAGGAPALETAKFSTADVPVSSTLQIVSVSPSDGSTVGVAHPIAVGFDRPVADREAVQAALNVTTKPAVKGAWYWIDEQYVHYRPQEFWPANTRVTLRTKLKGVKVGDEVVGGEDRTVNFTTGRQQLLSIDVREHRMQVVRNGKVVRTFQVSTGKKGWETRNGIKVLMGKERDKEWTNEEIGALEEYEYHSDYAMRMTNSGEFIHDAPWNKGNIGETNSSHGCVGLTVRDMEWLYENSIVGDPIIVRGSPKPYKDLINRYADWNISWARWSRGNV